MSGTITPSQVVRAARADECALCMKLLNDTMFQSTLGCAETVEEYQQMMRWVLRELDERREKLLQPPKSPLRTTTTYPYEQPPQNPGK